MSILKKAITLIVLTLMTGSLALGYAAVTDTLTITGQASFESKPYEGVYIMDVSVVSESGAEAVVTDYLLPTNLLTTVRAEGTGGKVTYKVTVHNNTPVTYWYIRRDMITDYESNDLIGASGGITILTNDKIDETSGTFNTEDWIPPGTMRDIYVTYTYGARAQGDEFLKVLNDGVTTRGYEYLTNAFEEQYAKDGSTTIDSVNNPEVFSELFGDLIVNFDGEEKQATVVVRRENVDDKATGDSYDSGPSGCEYTVYITVEDPTAAGTVEVYAISYTHGSANTTGMWYQLGQLYRGTATTNADGTFNYETWRASAETYTVADGITYKVGQQNGDQYDIMKTLEQLMSTHDQDIFNDINNTRILKKVYDILEANKNSDDPAVIGLRNAFENASPYYNIYNNGQQIDIKRNYTRAEIIPVIAAIQHALDYYHQTVE